MDPEVINLLVSEGNPIIKYESEIDIDISRIKVDIETGQLVTFEPPPPEPTIQPSSMSFTELINLFTTPEQLAIMSSPDPRVRLFTFMAAGATVFSTNSNEFINGIDYLISVKIIDASRKQQILDRIPPT